ncbi:MAG TPA: glycogen/starch synthase [Polyangiales bacterium]|nr:glycogen/starch synthase [Polyangiales bacterium]
MEILFVTSELAPYSVRALAPEIAETAASLPKALRGLGHRVTVVSPLYKGIDPAARSLARRLSTLNVEAAGKSYGCTVYDGRTTGGIDLIFLGNAELFGERTVGEGDDDLLLRSAVVLSGAAAQLATSRDPRAEVLHAHGAHGALALTIAKTLRPELACVLSLHDAHEAFDVTSARIADLGLPEAVRHAFDPSHPSLLAAGIHSADAVVASSHASAIALLEDSRSPLAAALRAKGSRFSGIVNGVDASIWNPLIDSQLSARFDATNLSGKARCKGSLQYMVGLGVNPDVPLVVAAGELSDARGGDLIADIAGQALRNEVQLCVLGTEGPIAERLNALAIDHPERLALRTSFDEKERHLAIGGSDFLLLPAREPRALEIALSALRYGSLPIVSHVGALADVIVDADAKLETGNGFVTPSHTWEDLLATLQRAIGAYAEHAAFNALRKRAMRQDVTWERSARRYEHVYKQILQVNSPAA